MRIGITGGIAAGKSAVASALAEKLPHFVHVSIDTLVQEVYTELGQDGGSEQLQILRAKLLDLYGTCHKPDLAKLIVETQTILDSLEQLFTPVMREKMMGLLEPEADIVMEFPLLFEKGYWPMFDMIVNVEAPEAVRKARAMARPGMTETKLELIMGRQRQDNERRAGSHYSFVNEGLEALAFHTDAITIRALTVKQKVGIVSGSFDPITNGHLHLVLEGLKLMDFIVIAIAHNPNKKGMFSFYEKLTLTRNAVHEYLSDMTEDPQAFLARTYIVVMPQKETLVGVADMLKARYIIRGLRNSTDFEYERQIDLVQRRISPWIETLYMMTPRELTEVSSSMVKSLHGLNGWEQIAEPYIPRCVLGAMKEKLNA